MSAQEEHEAAYGGEAHQRKDQRLREPARRGSHERARERRCESHKAGAEAGGRRDTRSRHRRKDTRAPALRADAMRRLPHWGK